MLSTPVIEREQLSDFYKRGHSTIVLGDALDYYRYWEPPTVIISDGPYGLASYPGDPPTPRELGEAYRRHLRAWSEYSLPSTTLWFWNSELGWATVHPVIEEEGWEYRSCHVWDKGIAHAAGNSNTKTLRKFPVVSEVCVQYVRKVTFPAQDRELTMREWLRREWQRSGLPLHKANDACGVKNAATRKYFAQCHLWYFPPADAFTALAKYANKFGDPTGCPYFSLDGVNPVGYEQWKKMRAKFHCKNGITNVWREGAVRGAERMKNIHKCLHMNQKPLRLLEICIEASSDRDDVVWEPFGGLCSASIAAHGLGRRSHAAELNPEYFKIAKRRLENYGIF